VLVGTGPGAGVGLVVLIGGLLTAAVGVSCFIIRPIREIETLLSNSRSENMSASIPNE